MYGSERTPPPVWPDQLKSFSVAKPQQQYTQAEQIFAEANGWSVLRGPYPERFGDLSFAEVTRLIKCPSVFLGKDGECLALIVYGPLYGEEASLATLGNVVIDLLPWSETAFLIRLTPSSEAQV